MGIGHFRKASMRFWSPQNSTLLLLTRLGTFEEPIPVIKREISSFNGNFHVSHGSSLWIDSKYNHFHLPKHQVALFHSSTWRALRDGDSLNEGWRKKNRHKKTFDGTESIPIFVLPGLTSFLFYSTRKDESIFSEGKNYNISTGVYCIPKTENPPQRSKICTPTGCGEDSFAIAQNDQEIVLAVADGVGGWRKHGVNPAFFAQALMLHTAEIACDPDQIVGQGDVRPKNIIHDAFWRLIEDFKSGKTKPFGSSTACVVMINRENGKLNYANLGDSGVIVLTPAAGLEYPKLRVKFQSRIQQHRFNAPYQITLAPPDGKVNDTSDLADTNSSFGNADDLKLDVGDIVVVVTDGVLDNIATDELAQLISESYENHSQKHSQRELAHLISRDVALEARKLSQDDLRDSPFSAEAKKRGLTHFGGKEDDITVLTAVILPKRSQ